MSALAAFLGQTGLNQVTLSGAGAAIMTISVAIVLGLNVFCMSRILREQKPSEHHHAPLDINTRDTDS